jgi:hypothetical protein
VARGSGKAVGGKGKVTLGRASKGRYKLTLTTSRAVVRVNVEVGR